MSDTEIDREYERLGVDPKERGVYTGALAQNLGQHDGDVLAQLRDCWTRADLDSLAERGVIAPELHGN